MNVLFEWSAGAMVAGPVFGILASVLGFGFALFADRDQRLKLVVGYVLLIILAFASIVVPN